MTLITQVSVGFVAALHLLFFVMESYLWKKPIGLKIFRMDQEQANRTSVLALNQGVYNGFLAAGLIRGLSHPDAAMGREFIIFYLASVVVAGLVGGATVGRNILFLQAAPAVLALSLLFLS